MVQALIMIVTIAFVFAAALLAGGLIQASVIHSHLFGDDNYYQPNLTSSTKSLEKEFEGYRILYPSIKLDE